MEVLFSFFVCFRFICLFPGWFLLLILLFLLCCCLFLHVAPDALYEMQFRFDLYAL